MQCFDAAPVSGGGVATMSGGMVCVDNTGEVGTVPVSGGGVATMSGGMVCVDNTGEVGQAGSGHNCGLSTPQCFHRRLLYRLIRLLLL